MQQDGGPHFFTYNTGCTTRRHEYNTLAIYANGVGRFRLFLEVPRLVRRHKCSPRPWVRARFRGQVCVFCQILMVRGFPLRGASPPHGYATNQGALGFWTYSFAYSSSFFTLFLFYTMPSRPLGAAGLSGECSIAVLAVVIVPGAV